MKVLFNEFVNAAFLAAANVGHAQSYPAKPVRILVGHAPGNVATEIAANAPCAAVYWRRRRGE
jgi:tripartite-type tricarboxylate transporter receptor subunit TctC